MRFWAQRGLVIYNAEAARPEAVTDLRKRLAYADAKMAAGDAPRPPVREAREVSVASETGGATTETLVCSNCGAGFARVRTRGRKPLRCPTCRGVG
jgi:hypothetical protein